MGSVIWLTGIPGSGKSTIAKELKKLKPDITILRLDEIRKKITPKPTYTDKEREEVYSKLIEMAMFLDKEGKNVIIDATGHKRKWRNIARKGIKNFYEVWVRCPLGVCMKREASRKDNPTTANLYKKALKGEIKNLPGSGVPYEEPKKPDLIIDSDKVSASEVAKKISHSLQKGWRSARPILEG